jgi:S1-C subfamily serine protease
VIRVALASTAAAALALAAVGYAHSLRREDDVRTLRTRVGRLERKLDSVSAKNALLAGELRRTKRRLKQKDAGLAPLASRVLRSVFTIQTNTGWLGAGFVAWVDGGDTYFVTAYHVVAHSTRTEVAVAQKGGSWNGEIVRGDPKHDLAVVRVSGRPRGAPPLWQYVRSFSHPRTGDALLLVGSPYGLEGTVTTGVVSRVGKRYIQTDAAANPGNSGGPAVDRRGHIVGVLVAGGGENLNFVVPIENVCATLRDCSAPS